jgi:hypothetical protein
MLLKIWKGIVMRQLKNYRRKILEENLKARKNVFSTSNDIKAHSFEIHYEIVATMKKNSFSLLIFLLSLLADCATRNDFSAFWTLSKTYEDVQLEKSLKLNFSFRPRKL